MLRKTLTILALCAVFFFGGYITHSLRKSATGAKADTIRTLVTDTRVDTFWKVLPMPLMTRTLTEYVVVRDSVGNEIEVPREQKVYEDSTYYAVVSGVSPRLDSIRVHERTRHVTETRTITIQKETKHWRFGPQAGIGITMHGISPYAGVGLTYIF